MKQCLVINLTKVTKTLQANTDKNLIIVKKKNKPNSFSLVIWKRFSVSNQKPNKTTQEIILMKRKNLCFLERLLLLLLSHFSRVRLCVTS